MHAAKGALRRISFGIAALTLAATATAQAQSALPVPAEARDSVEQGYYALKWWHGLVVAGGIGALTLVDESVQEYMQDHQDGTRDDVADVAAEFHQPEVFIASSLGAMSLGLVLRKPKVAETGLQILTAYGLSSGMMIATKWVFGRDRPSDTPDDPYSFNWFEGGSDSAFPSGAAAVTFSLATTVADAVDKPVVTVLLYAGATLNSWSRVYQNKHWLSDVALGAVYGITAAKIVNGRWRLFGWKPPTVGIGTDGSFFASYDIRH